MPYTVINQTQDYVHIRIQDLFSVKDLLALQDLALTDLQNSNGFCVLIELRDFAGWSHEPEWENTAFLPANDSQVTRIAFVGDERWRDDVFMFTGQPMRSNEIAFFTSDQWIQAEAWLNQDLAG